MVLLVDQGGGTLVAIEHQRDVVQAFGHRHCLDLFKQLVDLGLLAQDQGNVVAEDIDGGVELDRQALFVDGQLVQPDQYVGGLVIGGHLGELEAAEHQVVGVGGDVVQAQFVGICKLP
ncbi:hypothetical protein D3C76_1283350 [compost metagenome]